MILVGLVASSAVAAMAGVWGLIPGEAGWKLVLTFAITAMATGAFQGIADYFFKETGK
jgi:hypothetical protein